MLSNVKRTLLQIKRNSGLSLPEVLISTGILAIIALGVTSLMETTHKAGSQITASSNVQEIRNLIKMKLNSGFACRYAHNGSDFFRKGTLASNTFATFGPHTSANPSSDIDYIYLGETELTSTPGNPIDQALIKNQRVDANLNVFGLNSLVISEIYMKEIFPNQFRKTITNSSYNQSYLVWLFVTFQAPTTGGLKNLLGSSRIRVRIPMYIVTDTNRGHRIVDCGINSLPQDVATTSAPPPANQVPVSFHAKYASTTWPLCDYPATVSSAGVTNLTYFDMNINCKGECQVIVWGKVNANFRNKSRPYTFWLTNSAMTNTLDVAGANMNNRVGSVVLMGASHHQQGGNFTISLAAHRDTGGASPDFRINRERGGSGACINGSYLKAMVIGTSVCSNCDVNEEHGN